MDNNSTLNSDSFDTTTNFETYNLTQLPYWVHNLQISYLGFVFILGTIGNGLLLTIQRKKDKKSSTDYFILAMAGLEILCSCISTTLNMLRSERVWIYTMSSALCKALVFVSYQINFSQVLLLASIAVDRYLKTCKPLKTSITVKKAKLICGIVILSGVLIGSPCLATYNLDKNFDCGHRHLEIRFYQRVLVGITTVTLGLVSIAYIKVALAVRRRHNQHVERKLNSINMPEGSLSDISSSTCWKLFKNRASKIKAAPADRLSNSQTNMSTISTTSKTTTVPFHSDHQHIDDVDSKSKKSPELQVKFNNYMNTVQSVPHSQDKSRSFLTVPGWQSSRNQVVRNLMQEQQKVNRTTRTLFLITFIHIMIFVIQMMLVVPSVSFLGVVARYFSQTISLINCVVNPLLIFGLHARCREEVKKLFVRRAR